MIAIAHTQPAALDPHWPHMNRFQTMRDKPAEDYRPFKEIHVRHGADEEIIPVEAHRDHYGAALASVERLGGVATIEMWLNDGKRWHKEWAITYQGERWADMDEGERAFLVAHHIKALPVTAITVIYGVSVGQLRRFQASLNRGARTAAMAAS